MVESTSRTIKVNAVSKPNHSKGKNNNNNKNSGNFMGPNKNEKQFKGKKDPCFVCGKLDHYPWDYRYQKDQKRLQRM